MLAILLIGIVGGLLLFIVAPICEAVIYTHRYRKTERELDAARKRYKKARRMRNEYIKRGEPVPDYVADEVKASHYYPSLWCAANGLDARDCMKLADEYDPER